MLFYILFSFFPDQNITEINVEDLKYFVNIEELDLSENFVNINDLSSLPILRSLKMRSSMLEHISIEKTPNTFLNLQNLDLAFNKLSHEEMRNLFHLPQIR